MDIVIFKDLTTDGVISSIEENSKKYHDGFYADMNNAPERKLVKESAAEIGGIIKEIKASGIKIRKSKIAEVNKEEKEIIERLENANLPFTLLIDDYTAGRKVILEAEKARVKAIEDAQQLENDHEMGLLLNDKFDLEQIKAAAEKAGYEQKLKDDAAAEATRKAEQLAKDNEVRIEQERQAAIQAQAAAEQATKDAIEREKQASIDAESRRIADIESAKQAEIAKQAKIVADEKAADAARLANKEHVRAVNNDALNAIMLSTDVTLAQAKAIVTSIAKNEILNVTINY